MWQFTNRQLNREFDMSFRKASLVAMLAVSMAGTPVLAQSAQRAPAATSQTARAGANVEDSNELRGGFIIPVLALLAVIAGILAATSGGGNRPTSP
jgi:hypothetical protein